MFDAETGRQVGPTLSGSDHQIDVRPQLSATMSDGVYAHLHTHPGSSSFSDLDAGFLLTWPQISVIVVAALDGRWYVMSRKMDVPAASVTEVIGAFRGELALLLDNSGLAVSERPHQIWARIADRVGLRYHRIGSSDE